jgi:hypothetical protein
MIRNMLVVLLLLGAVPGKAQVHDTYSNDLELIMFQQNQYRAQAELLRINRQIEQNERLLREQEIELRELNKRYGVTTNGYDTGKESEEQGNENP